MDKPNYNQKGVALSSIIAVLVVVLITLTNNTTTHTNTKVAHPLAKEAIRISLASRAPKSLSGSRKRIHKKKAAVKIATNIPSINKSKSVDKKPNKITVQTVAVYTPELVIKPAKVMPRITVLDVPEKKKQNITVHVPEVIIKPVKMLPLVQTVSIPEVKKENVAVYTPEPVIKPIRVLPKITAVPAPQEKKTDIAKASEPPALKKEQTIVSSDNTTSNQDSSELTSVSSDEQIPDIIFPAPTENTIVIKGNAQLAKLDAYQNPLGSDAKSWNCVVDRTTGLIWEAKTSNHGLQDEKNYYSWYEPSQVELGGDAGLKNNGNCRGGINCDTSSYTKAINEISLCGYSDWRLPTRKELMSLVQYTDATKKNGLIDKTFFPRGTVDWYWSSDTDSGDPSHAWYVLYYNGRQMKALKSQAKRIRLVRKGLSRSFKNHVASPEGKTEVKSIAKLESTQK